MRRCQTGCLQCKSSKSRKKLKFAAGDSEPSFGQASSQLLHICIAVAAERAMGDNKGRPCARGTSPSPHFLSGVWSETHNTHTHTSTCCCCLTCHVFAATNSTAHKFHYSPLHWIWITPAVQSFPESLHWVIGWVGHQVLFALVWFSLSTDPAPLFRA